MGLLPGVWVVLQSVEKLQLPAHRQATGKMLLQTCTARSVKGCAVSPAVGSC